MTVCSECRHEVENGLLLVAGGWGGPHFCGGVVGGGYLVVAGGRSIHTCVEVWEEVASWLATYICACELTLSGCGRW